MLESKGVVNDVPDAIEVPPVKEVYQFTVPEDGLALRVTVPEPQLEPGFVAVMVAIA